MNELVKQVNEWIDKEIYGEEETVIVCKTSKSIEEINEEVREVFKQLVTDAMTVTQTVVKREDKAYITVVLKAYSKEKRGDVFRLATSRLKDHFDIEGGVVFDTKEVEVHGVFNERKDAESAWEKFPAIFKEITKGEEEGDFSFGATCTEHFTKDGRAVGTILSVTVRVEIEGDSKLKDDTLNRLATQAIDRASRLSKGITYLKTRLLKRLRGMDDSQKETHVLKEKKKVIFHPTGDEVEDFLEVATLFATHAFLTTFGVLGDEKRGETFKVESNGKVTMTGKNELRSVDNPDFPPRAGLKRIFKSEATHALEVHLSNRKDTDESRARRAKSFGEGYIRFVSGETKEMECVMPRILACTDETLVREYLETHYAFELLERDEGVRTFEENVGQYVSIRTRGDAASIVKATLLNTDIPYTQGGGGDVTLFTIDTITFLTHYDKIYDVVDELRESGAKVDYIVKNDVTRTFIKILESHFE